MIVLRLQAILFNFHNMRTFDSEDQDQFLAPVWQVPIHVAVMKYVMYYSSFVRNFVRSARHADVLLLTGSALYYLEKCDTLTVRTSNKDPFLKVHEFISRGDHCDLELFFFGYRATLKERICSEESKFKQPRSSRDGQLT